MCPTLLYRGETFNANFTYFSGLDIDHSFMIADGNRKTLLVPGLNAALARKRFRGKVVTYSNAYESIGGLLMGRKAGADLSSLPAKAYVRLSRICRLHDCSEELYSMRAKKSPREIRKLRRAAKTTKSLIESLEIRSGMSEKELKTQLLVKMAGMGLEPSFEPIVSSGANTAFPHSTSGNAKLRGHVMVDCGVRYENYCGDITRCVIIGRNPKLERMYECLEGVCHSVIDSIPDMRHGGEVARFAEKEMKKRGLPPMIHSIGHGIGLDVHEYPRLSEKYGDCIKGTTFTIEPGAYMRSFGLRFEEMVYFDGRKARIL